MKKKQKIKAIILASGSGRRFNKETPKQFLEIAGMPMFIHTLKPFETCKGINEILIVTLPEYIRKTLDLINQYSIRKIRKIIKGGITRQESSWIGIQQCGTDTNYVLIHDVVRPFITSHFLDEIIREVKKHGAVVPTIPTSDTILEVDKEGFIKQILDRKNLRRVQTPQAFKYELIKEAHERAIKNGIKNSTDDCSLLIGLGYPIYTLKGDEKNIKITFPMDFQIAETFFKL